MYNKALVHSFFIKLAFIVKLSVDFALELIKYEVNNELLIKLISEALYAVGLFPMNITPFPRGATKLEIFISEKVQEP